jgi:type I restriction enzyme, S subunit
MRVEFGKRYKVADLIENGVLSINDGYRAKNSELAKDGIPFARAGNINNGFHFEGADCIPANDIDKVGAKISKTGDVLFTSKGTVGRFGFVQESTPRFVYSPQLCFWRSLNNGLINPRWLYYWMHGGEFTAQVNGVAGQTDMADYVSLRDQRNFTITIPEPSDQSRIASILGSLDDKIELNRRMNATLESMAQAIFKSWFINFDPVHRNAAHRSGLGNSIHRTEGMSIGQYSKIDSLFPDSLEESDIGPVPKDWSVEMLGSHSSITRGLSYKGSGLADTGKPMFNLNSVLEGGGYKKAGIKYYTGDYFDKHEVLPGDLLVANTEQGFDRLLIGYAAVVPEYFTDGGIYSHHVYRVRPNSNSPLTARYLERWINSPLPHEWITGYSNGTTVNMLPVDGLTNAQVLLPPREIIHAFTDIANSIAAQQQANDQASMHYSQTRDLLLPQLMSGHMLNVR